MSESFSLPAFTMADYNLYRVDDRVFFVFIAAALAFCIIHAARRAFRQPQPTEDHGVHPPGGDELQRHTLFQRIYHWANSVAIFTLLISGWMIYQPQRFPSFEAGSSKWFSCHSWGVALLLVGIVFHVIYESFISNRENPMVVRREEVKRTFLIFKNFFGLSKIYPSAGKYHPGQVGFHWIVTGNLFLLILTGSVIWKPFRDLLPLSLLGLGWDFIYYNRLLHGLFSATLLASLIGHLYFALLIKKNWRETKSMITGRVTPA